MRPLILSCFFILLFACQQKESTKQYRMQYQHIDVATESNFRGLSIAKDRSIWISGTQGTILRSVDEGQHWDRFQIPNTDSIDFRDIEAFDAQHAITLSAGSPALIYETKNGGKDWVLRYADHDPKIFLDGMDFSNATQGMVFGDPIHGKLSLLKTENGGESWEKIPRAQIPNALEVEAGFAASGTSIVCIENEVWIGLGGEQSRVFYSADFGEHWTAKNSAMLSGTAMQGIYSMSFKNNKIGIAVGGEWNSNPEISHIYTSDGGKNWQVAKGVQAYRSGSTYLFEDVFIATGKGGTDLSTDNGATWKALSSAGWYSIASSADGKLIVGTGKQGKVSLIRLEAYSTKE